MSNPRVSVIVPSYNHAQFLEQRLESVLNQSFQDFELYVLDDASSDNSLQVLEKYKDEPRLQILGNEVNSGSPFVQWNRGLDLAQGDYVWIAESDDYADTDLLKELVLALDSNPGAGIAYCQSLLISGKNDQKPPVLAESIHEMFVDYGRWQSGYTNSGKNELANYLTFRNVIPNASGVLIRRSFLGERIRAPESMKLAGDWMFWARILLVSDVVFVPRPLNYFRESHMGSQRDRTKQQALELIEGLDVYEFIRSNVELVPALRKRILAYHVKLWGILSCLRMLSWDTNRKVYAKFLEIHREFYSRRITLIILPFLAFYVSAPLRKVPSAMTFFKHLRRLKYKFG